MTKSSFSNSRRSTNDYFQWRLTRARATLKELKKLAHFNNTSVLDVGCGHGALSLALLNEGAKVTATEIHPEGYSYAKQRLGKKHGFRIYKVQDERLPGPDQSYDWVMLMDVLEHVANPSLLITEVRRVLKPQGYVYVDLTPYSSIVGHHLYDLTLLPIHVLPTRWIKKYVYNKSNKLNKEKFAVMTADTLWETFSTLNKITIGDVEKLMRSFKLISEQRLLVYPDKLTFNLSWVKYLPFGKDWLVTNFRAVYQS
jgi:ubiquinone/menaquinone biosynthesis C-methylase UbiE